MNEIEILEYAFNKYCQIINNYNTKIDTMFLTTYENKYKNNLIEFFEKIKKETGLIFDSEEIYIMLENEIKKSIENLQNSIEEINQNLINQGHECLNNNYSFQYDMIGRISDDLIKNNQDRANSYSITNINEKFISYFIDSLYTQNSFINRTMLDKIEKELYYYIENTLKTHKKNMLNESYKLNEYDFTKIVLEELHIFIEKNRVLEKQKKASIPKSKSMLKASTIFGLTNEVLNEVVKSLKANVINMSDIDEIISNTGHKEISNEEFKIKVQEQLNNSNLSSVEQVDISKKQVVQTIFSNSDTISNKKIQCKSKAHLKALAIFGLTEKLVDEIINSLKNYIISINDVDEILSQCEFKFISPEQAMKKINTSLEKQIPIKTVFKNYDDQQIEENASKKM